MSHGYEALRNGAAWLDLDARGRITARGRDRVRLLHSLTTFDVKKMQTGDACYAFLLNPQGRIQADFDMLALADSFLLDTEPELREKLFQLIKRYIIADQVELEDVSAGLSSVGVEGPTADAIALPAGDFVKAPFRVTGQPGFRVYCKPEERSALIRHLEAAGAVAASAADARLVRMENGKPRYGEDIRDTSLPQETQQMQAVSFNKGCYLGQEIVERIRALGQVHKKLERFELEGAEPPAPGTRLNVDGAEAEITSAIFSPRLNKVVAMGYVRR